MLSSSASYFDGQSSKCQAVTVSLTDTLLCIKSDVELNQFEKMNANYHCSPALNITGYNCQIIGCTDTNNPNTADLKRHFSLSGQVISKLERHWWMVAFRHFYRCVWLLVNSAWTSISL